jgi:UDP-N-acetylglucosamine 2-epimerase (non-hydrolysing)
MKKVLFIFGTRPEAIKLAPLILEFKKYNTFDTLICITGQHKELINQVLRFFNIKPDYNLKIMQKNQSLAGLTAKALTGINETLQKVNPDLIFVQGDTTSVLAAALCAFYRKIKIAHIEAGLRTNNKFYPFPEEINRKVAGIVTDFHFAPTPNAKKNLNRENINDNIWIVGNTVIDALFLTLKIIDSRFEQKLLKKFRNIDFNKSIILVTCHRRESFGSPFSEICRSLKEISLNKDVEIIYPVHLNPNIKEVAYDKLSGIPNIKLVPPLSYPELVWFMNKCYLILTDSGGIQEEAPSLGKPVLVLRNETERTEGIEAGTVRLVGADYNKIVYETNKLLSDGAYYGKMQQAVNPYGDGTSSQKIYSIIRDKL